ncbi:hypothetical protein OBP_013 [Pseudomonas phage OBP]|uniref:hypothetical protein n=1 Tax=Pseudomonas phage OBP TaxID=1124849 RepID=UPI000240D60A|nr:hypothetical protein OBP_013 [Pseudomonas phage OBP]AEV89450.1 hypothetical protein OBP_013 [Pseudomonas phage OBP]
MEVPEGFVPNDFKYVSEQPHLTVTGFSFFNPLIARLTLEVGIRESKPYNVFATKPAGILNMPSRGMFYHSPLNGIPK